MRAENSEQLFWIFFSVWIVLGLFSAWLLLLNKDAALKRKVFPPFMVGAGVLFACFVWAMGLPPSVLAFFLPFVGLIIFLNIRKTRFCDGCGATVMSRTLSTPEFCSSCGAKLEA